MNFGVQQSMTRYLRRSAGVILAASVVLAGVELAPAQQRPPKTPKTPAADAPAATKPATQPSASSLIEDRAAKKLLAAGDSRIELDQPKEALELYQQVIERYPRSAVRFEAYMRLGKYYLDKGHDPAKARGYFERTSVEENDNLDLRGEAMLLIGRSYYEQSKWQQAFASLRTVTIQFPGTEFANQAYFYIGNAHYKLGAYNRAIEALSKVGTAVSDTEQGKKVFEIGKRLFVRITDQDLTAIPEGTDVTAKIESASGDAETIKFTRVGAANSATYLAEIDTALGDSTKGDGVLQVCGTDTVTITYTDAQTASGQINIPRKIQLHALHKGIADFMDGAFRDPLKSIVVGKTAYVRVIDLDRDVSPNADTVNVKVIAKRLIAKPPAAAQAKDPNAPSAVPTTDSNAPDEEAKPQYAIIDEATLTLTERPREEAVQAPQNAVDNKPKTVHTGVFGGSLPILLGDAVSGDGILQVQVGDILEVHYNDEFNTTDKPRDVVGTCQTVTGSLGEVKVANQEIKDQQLELQTRLKKAEALTNIGRIYKQLGLKEQADRQFRLGIDECEALAARARNLGGEVLENMYVRLWKLYLELDDLDKAAAMCLALEREFPNSQFVDEALLGLGETSMKRGEPDKAITIFKRVLELPQSPKKAEALFDIGQCQEKMAQPKLDAGDNAKPNQQLIEAAFQSYQQVYQKYPMSAVAGEAIGKMGDYYVSIKDYDRATTTFQQALDEYPDALFIDRLLFDYGKCLIRMNKPEESLAKFRQLLSEYPQSKYATETRQRLIPYVEKKISGD